MTTSLHVPVLDLVIIAIYMAAILLVGIVSARRTVITGQVFFLAGRSLSWGVVGAALFASNISTIHLVGLTASGYNEGLVWGNFEWMASFSLILLSLIFAPFYFRSRISTLPEFLERRYSPASRSILAIMAILAALFIHIGMSLYAGAVVFQQFFGIRVDVSILIVSAIVSVYTIFGGLKAVVVTETFNTAILLMGVCIITVFAVLALPAHGIHTLAAFRAAVKPDQLHVIRSNSTVGLNWYAIFLGYPILGLWYWCTDQTIVQRVLGAKTERDAQLGPLFAGFLKILPMFLLVLPGVIAYVLFRDQIGTASNQTLPVLIERLIPTGLRGSDYGCGACGPDERRLRRAEQLRDAGCRRHRKASSAGHDRLSNGRDRPSEFGGRHDSGDLLVDPGGTLLEHLRGDQCHCRRSCSTYHDRLSLRGLLAQRHEGGFRHYTGERPLHGRSCVPIRPPGHREHSLDYRRLGHLLPDAGVVDVLHMQRHLCDQQPVHARPTSPLCRGTYLDQSLGVAPRDTRLEQPARNRVVFCS